MIELREVSHAYRSLRALESVSFTVQPGTVVGLVGPNGAGKTTLIRAIATVLRQRQGHIRVAGHDTIQQAAGARQALGFLPERANPYPDLLAWEHLDLFATIAGHGGAERRHRVDAALAAAGLEARRMARCAELSKGQRQRLALQASLLHDPVALVLDEPTDGMDPESRGRLLATVRELAAAGAAVLLSSHVLSEIEQVADEVVILSAGRVVHEPSVTEPVRVLLTTRQAPEEALPVALASAAVEHASIEDGGLLVRLAAGQPDAAPLVEALVAAGLAVVSVTPVGDRLRDRYRSALAEGGA